MDFDNEYTVWCGNLCNQMDEELLYELFLQVAPVKRVMIPQHKSGGKNMNYGFVTFSHLCSVQYAIDMFSDSTLFERNIIVRSRHANSPNAKPGPPGIMPPMPMLPSPPQAQNIYHGRDRPHNIMNQNGAELMPLMPRGSSPPPQLQRNYHARDMPWHMMNPNGPEIMPRTSSPPQHSYHGRDRPRHGQNKFSNDKPYQHRRNKSSYKNRRHYVD